MVTQLATAVKIAGLTYRLLSTSVMIGFLAGGVYCALKDQREQKRGR